VSISGIGTRYVGKRRKPVSCEFLKEYMHTNVTKMFKEGGMLIVVEGKRPFKYDMSRIVSIQVREHKRSGIQYV
jgi:hypothetical protein